MTLDKPDLEKENIDYCDKCGSLVEAICEYCNEGLCENCFCECQR